MNDTNENHRQIKLLKYLFTHSFASRLELEQSLGNEKKSRITIIRDLNYLLHLGWIEYVGAGKLVRYHLKPGKELLIPVDMEAYFSKTTDARSVAFPSFNFNVIKNLDQIFSKKDMDLFNQGKVKLASKLKTLDKTLIKNLGVSSGIRKSAVGITGTKYVPLGNMWQIEEALTKIVAHVKKIDHV